MPEQVRRTRPRRGKPKNRSSGNNRQDEKSQEGSTVAVKEWNRNKVDKQAKDTEGQAEGSGQDCIVCAEEIQVAALTSCNHIVCEKCALRQRVLYEKKQCLVCRTDVDRMIFTYHPPSSLHYDDVPSSEIVSSEEKYGIDFTSEAVKEVSLGLLDWKCPIASCQGATFSTFKKLNEHVREKHNLVYCSLCAKFKKAFPSELKLYTTRELQKHQAHGDEEGFKGHPMCKFESGKRFYSEDELFVHMREKHERCHVCDQIDSSKPQYFKDYNQLFEHFTEEHFVCTVPSCLDKKFVVFRDEFDLQAHMVKEHPELYGKDRVLFSTSASHFGTRLSVLSADERSTIADEVPEDTNQMKRLRLEERARHYLHYDQTKLDEFRKANQRYTDDELNAAQLYAEYQRIFGSDQTTDSEGTTVDYSVLIYELSNLFAAKSKKRKDLEAINGPALQQREMSEKFPALPGTSAATSVIGGNWASNQMRRGLSGTIENEELFPSLPATGNVRFTKKKSKKKSTWAPPVNAASIPGYSLSRNSSSASISSRPMASSSSASMSSILSGLSGAASTAPVIHTGTSSRTGQYNFTSTQPVKKLDDSLFPKLAPTKKKPPRVNPVNNSMGPWGSGIQENQQNTDDPFDMSGLGRSLRVKGKGKKKKVVYHIGVGH